MVGPDVVALQGSVYCDNELHGEARNTTQSFLELQATYFFPIVSRQTDRLCERITQGTRWSDNGLSVQPTYQPLVRNHQLYLFWLSE